MRRLLAVCLVLGCSVGRAQLPTGTHEADDTSREDAVNARIRDAETDLEKQDYKGATVKLKALAVDRPKDARVLYDLGYAEERDGDETGAVAAYAGAIAVDPAMGEPRVALGLMDARAGRMEKAHEELLGAANLTAEAPVLRGRALRALASMDETSHPDAAREELLAAVKLTGETPEDVLMGADLAAAAGDDADAGTGENADAKANAFALAEFDLGGEGVGVGWRPCGWAGAGAVAVGGCGEDFGVVCQGGGRRGEVGEGGDAATGRHRHGNQRQGAGQC